tara:strand:- start:37 stop:564 length:528 start_codon:yes stop_codon:yes gene_type:complete
MKRPLMPKATAIWLIENTSLSFKQIADFCKMHILEIEGIADGDVAVGIKGHNPIDSGQLNQEEIDKCQKNPREKLQILKNDLPDQKTKTKGKRYTSISLRQEKPYAIFWLIKKYGNELKDSQIAKLIGSTKSTINAIREGTYREAISEAKNPVEVGLCSYEDIQKALDKNTKNNK